MLGCFYCCRSSLEVKSLMSSDGAAVTAETRPALHGLYLLTKWSFKASLMLCVSVVGDVNASEGRDRQIADSKFVSFKGISL